jgi:peroxiredoxin
MFADQKNAERKFDMKRIVFALLTIIVTSVAACAQKDTTSLTKVGDKAPAFTCKTIDGRTIDITKLTGKVVWINFFATWCGPCNQELPVLQKNIWDKYKNNQAFALVVIGREHSEKEVRDFVTKKQFTMPFAPDPGREIFKLYATQNIPRNVIIGRDGRIVSQTIGYTPEEFRKLENLLEGELKRQ